MSNSVFRSDRRRVLRGMACGAAGVGASSFFGVAGTFAEELSLTPRQTKGPFYPRQMPLDTDNDLIIVNDSITPAVGKITHLSGRVLGSNGSPVRNALVEIWQVDHNGIYLNTGRARSDAGDANFQGFGRFLTGSTGEYYFRTIKPTPYQFRTAHIHFAIKQTGREMWTTQCYVKGEPRNARDSILRRIKDPAARESVLADFVPVDGSRSGEYTARFDIVPGVIPEA